DAVATAGRNQPVAIREVRTRQHIHFERSPDAGVDLGKDVFVCRSVPEELHRRESVPVEMVEYPPSKAIDLGISHRLAEDARAAGVGFPPKLSFLTGQHGRAVLGESSEPVLALRAPDE